MGKIAGREFTHHSDLDLIFLYEGGPDEVAVASRIGQRLIAYLTTMTGAGIAYAVDTRLRPSGQKGMLVTSFEGFTRYQCETAETWEHLALLRSRPIAGEVAQARRVVRSHTPERVARRRQAVALSRRPARPRRARAREGGIRAARLQDRAGRPDGHRLPGGRRPAGAGRPRVPGLPERRRDARLHAPGRAHAARCAPTTARCASWSRARAGWRDGRSRRSRPRARGWPRSRSWSSPGSRPRSCSSGSGRLRRRIRAAYQAVVSAETIAALPA